MVIFFPQLKNMFYILLQHRKSSKHNQVNPGIPHSDHRETTDTMKCLQDQLRKEIEEHIKGKNALVQKSNVVQAVHCDQCSLWIFNIHRR